MDTTILFTSISYAFHLIATVIWLGWSVLLVIAHRFSTTDADDVVLADVYRFTRRTMPIALLSFAVLAGTGLYQMASDQHYEDLLVFNNAWSQLLFLKHIAFLAEAVVLLAIRFVIQPDLDYYRRAAAQGRGAGLAQTQRRYRWAAWLNLALGTFVLLITAMLTALP